MKSEHYDLIAIGAGSAARDGANKAAKDYGAKVALIEAEHWGGSCPNVACVPTKAYLVAAGLAHSINKLANERGIEVGPATTNLAKVKAWKDSLKKPQPKWVEDLGSAGFETHEGEASLVDAHTVRVGEQELIRHVKMLLDSVKAPKRIHIVAQLPRSAVGKVLRREAKSMVSVDLADIPRQA